MQTILTVLHVLLSIGLVGLVLLQHGKGADAGAAFGGGASATVFGARGAGNFLSRATAILAALFFATSIALAYYATQAGAPESLMDRGAAGGEVPVPAVNGPPEPEAESGTLPAPEASTPTPTAPAVPTPSEAQGVGDDVPAVDDVPVPTGQ